jgi:hypothetical protein
VGELRYRDPGEVTAPAVDGPQRRDSPYQRGPGDTQQTTADARPARDDGRGYDPDAEFKRPVPKPPGYLPDDSDGHTSRDGALREHREGDTEPSRQGTPADGRHLVQSEGVVGMPRPDESADGDRGEEIRAVIDRPEFHDPLDNRCPDRYGDPLTRADGTRIPCLDGPPRREQTTQGWAGDCGIIAALGAVAAHSPDEIIRRVCPREDGSYAVTFSEARGADGVTEPTGRDIELTVTPELPVYDDDLHTPACAQAETGTAWCAIFEKAFAGIDQTWTIQRRIAWMDDWVGLCAQDKADNVMKQRSGPAPTGYPRMHQGTTQWEQAEALTQLTGRPAVVREFPTGLDEWRINRVIRAQLTDDKPVLVSSRPEAYEGEELPHDLKGGHVYEVTGVEKGKIVLRNPWNRDHPQPMETDEFACNIRRYYSTLM